MNSFQPLAPCSAGKWGGLMWEGAADLGLGALTPLPSWHHCVTWYSWLLFVCRMRDGWTAEAGPTEPGALKVLFIFQNIWLMSSRA